jgi:hypothetical protein
MISPSLEPYHDFINSITVLTALSLFSALGYFFLRKLTRMKRFMLLVCDGLSWGLVIALALFFIVLVLQGFFQE